MRQRTQRQQAISAHIHQNNIDVLRRIMLSQTQHHRLNRRGRTTTGNTHQQQVAHLNIPAHRHLTLQLRLITQSAHQNTVPNTTHSGKIRVREATHTKISQINIRTQRLRPHLTRSNRTTSRMSRHNSINQQIQVIRITRRHLRTCTLRTRNTDTIGRTNLQRSHHLSAALTRHQGSLHRRNIILAQLHIGATHLRTRNLRSIRNTNHVRRILTALHTQRHTQVRIRQNVIIHHASRTLSRQNHVNTQGTTHRTNAHQRRQDIREVLRQHRELVNHQQQARHRLRRVCRQIILNVVHTLASSSKQALTTVHLRLQRLNSAVSQLSIQVAQSTNRMRQTLTRLKRRTTLKVNQNKVQTARIVVRSQTRHQRTQKLALTRTSGTTHQTVRTVLHQVQRERTRIAHTNLSAETISLRPKRLNILSTRRGRQTNQLRQLYQLRQTAAQKQTLRVLMMRQSTRHMKSILSAHTGEHTVSDRVTAARLRIGHRSLLTNLHDRSTRRRKAINRRSQHNTGNTASARSSSLIRHQTHFIAVRQKVACRRLTALSEGIRINDHAQAAGRKGLNVVV